MPTNFEAEIQNPAKVTTTVPSLDESSTLRKPSGLRWLPNAFYYIAWLLFIGWSIIAFSTRNWWTGLGWGMVSGLACLATGRVIKLLQNIDDELYRKRMSE